MRIGIVPNLNASGGGVYQYSLTMIGALDEWRKDGCDDEFILVGADLHVPSLASHGSGWDVKLLPSPQRTALQVTLDMLRQVVGEGPHREAWRWMRRKLDPNEGLPDLDRVQSRPEISRWFRRWGIELMLYPAPNTLSFETGIPYVMAIHDLQHRLQPEFPEVSANGEREWREYLFRNGSRYATLLLADSEIGKEDILNSYAAYGVTDKQVRVLPYLPAYYLAVDVSESERQRVRMTYHLPDRYLFYPAQFWPHKNHTRIVQALGLLKQEHGLKIPVMFCGSYAGEIRERTFHEVMLIASRLRLEKEIRYLGYVPDKDMSGIYAEALALIMPTFFGPTNIPILEAWTFGCPVLTSNIRGIREQTGDAAVLVDPRSVEAIADGIYRVWADENLRRTLADRGRQRLSSYTPEDYRGRLVEILGEAKIRVRTERPRNAS